jgi:hypothetical protein
MEKNNFKVINGGQADKPVVTREDRIESIHADIARQDELNRDEALDLVKRLKKERIADLRISVSKECGRILSDEEAGFIGDRYLGLASNDSQAKREVYERFPDLKSFFEKIIEQMNS